VIKILFQIKLCSWIITGLSYFWPQNLQCIPFFASLGFQDYANFLPYKELRSRKFCGKKTMGKPVVYLHKKSDRLYLQNKINVLKILLFNIISRCFHYFFQQFFFYLVLNEFLIRILSAVL